MPTCRHADMPTCWMTGLFGTASERQILMAGVRGRLEKGRQAAKATSCLCSVRPVARDKESPPRARHGERLSKGQGSASFIPSWRDATRSREPPSLSSRCKKQAGKQASRQASRQGGIRLLHHDVAAARHKGNNRGKAWGQQPPARPGGKERDERVEQLAPHGYLGGGHLKWPGRRYPVGVGGGSPLGHMPSGQTRGVSGGGRISCPGSAPPWLPCPSPSPGCRARRGAPARCPGYPPDTPWCSGRGAWRGFAGTWR